MFEGAFFRTKNIHTPFFACLFVLDSSLDRSEKNFELDLILIILRSSRWAKWLHTPGEQDIGRNDRNSLKVVAVAYKRLQT